MVKTGGGVKRQTLIALALLTAVIVYVVLPLIVKDYSADPAFSGILTGVIGLATLKNGGGEKDDNSDKEE